MMELMREVRLGEADVTVVRRPDGSMLVRAEGALEPYPEKLTLCLERWAAEAPDRVFLMQRAPDGGWREVTYAQALDTVRRVAQALLDRGLTRERGVAILMSTHTLEVAQEMCHRVSIILKGQIIARGTVDEVRALGGGIDAQLTEVFLKLTGGSALQEIDEAVG